MKHNSSLALFGYWNRRREERIAPLRREIEPADFQTTLPNVFILECAAENRIAFRLAGTAICSMFGRELRDHSLESIWLQDQAGSALKQVGHARERGLPLVIELAAESEAGRLMELEMLLLPLSSASAGIDRFLGTLNPLEKPFWLNLDPVVGVTTASLQLIDPGKERMLFGNGPEVSFPHNASIYRSRGFGRGAQRMHRLTVIEGGRED